MTVDFSLSNFFQDFRYRKRFKKYFKRNVFLDTFALCLIIQGKFDDNEGYNTLSGDKHNSFFMNIKTYRKLMYLIDISQSKFKLVITPAVLSESLRHMFEAIERKYSTSDEKKKLEEKFVNFLQNEIKIFKEKHPLIKDIITHRWIEEIKHHKLRDRIEIGELSIFVESDKCKCNAIITNDMYKKDKSGGQIHLPETIIVQLGILSLIN